LSDKLESDKELAEILAMARACSVTIHVRGTDKRPVVEILNKPSYPSLPRKVVGLKELYDRWKAYKSYKFMNNWKF